MDKKRGGGRRSKMSVCACSGYKNCPGGGGRVKKRHNSAHLVVELFWPYVWLVFKGGVIMEGIR